MKLTDVKPKKLQMKSITDFQQYCTDNHIPMREGRDLSQAFQVKYGADWLAVWWNKNNRVYTLDARLKGLVDDFKSQQHSIMQTQDYLK